MVTRENRKAAPAAERARKRQPAAPRPEPSQAARRAPAVAQAVQILRCLSTSPTPLGVAAVTRQVGLSPSSCFNVLRALVAEGLLTFDPIAKTYALGLGLVEIASPVLGMGYLDLIRPMLLGIAVRFESLVALWQVTPDERMILVERFHSDAAVRIELRPGQRLPAYVGAVGRCIAAHAELSETELFRRFSMLRWQTPIDFATYAAQVATARRDGFAIDRGHLLRGIDAVGTVVLDETGRPRFGIGSLDIAGHQPPDRLLELGAELHAAAQQIGRTLPWMQLPRQPG
jgi:DNA-binding IclR family transcriptional regulator